MTAGFADEFEQLMKASGQSRVPAPNQALEAWGSFVDDCENGFEWTIYEYDNELGIRDAMETVATSPALADFSELQIFHQRLAEIDDRFRRLLATGPAIRAEDRRWWHQRLPPTGGSDLVEDARSSYGVEIAEV